MMKPCANQRKKLAALALGLLEQGPARELRAHLQTCAGCRSYLAELSGVTVQLTAAEPAVELPASDKFHRSVMARIEARSAGPDWWMILDLLRAVPLVWRVALPMGAVVLLLIRLGIEQAPKGEVHFQPPTPTSVQVTIVAVDAEVDLAPTVANYQRVAEESPDKLDELLARQEPATARAMPVYTAAARSLSF